MGEITVQDMLAEMAKVCKISLLKEEDEVIRAIIRSKSKAQILRDLQTKYPKENLNMKDIDDFLIAYKDVFFDEAKKMQTAYGRRMIKQQEGLTNELIDLAITSKRLINKYEEQDDNTNTVGVLRVAADIYMKVGKVQGIFDDKQEISVNLQMDKLVQKITSEGTKGMSGRLQNMFEEDDVIDAEVVDD